MLGKTTLKSSRLSLFDSFLTLSCSFFLFAVRCRLKNTFLTNARLSLSAVFIILFSAVIYPQAVNSLRGRITPSNNYNKAIHLKEQVPKSYLERYNRWKAMLLSVEAGRRLWQSFAENPSFRLTIIVSKNENQCAKVDSYLWEEGKLVGATITLGHKIDSGYPSQFEYPVLGSLEFVIGKWGIEGEDILAAAKFAHELGHVEHAASDAPNYQIQNQLAPIYIKRFLSNGQNLTDPKLNELVARMGGAPMKISIARENHAEVYALRYLLDKLKTKKQRKLLKIMQEFIQPEFDYLFSSLINSAGYADLIQPRDR